MIELKHIKQSQETTCGAAALAMVYQFLGKTDQNEADIFKRARSERPNTNNEYYLRTYRMAEDSLTLDLTFFVGQAVQDSAEMALQPLREFLSVGVPVIVCQRVDQHSVYGHFRVVTSIVEDKIYLNDPLLDGPSVLSTDEFLKLWEKTNDDEVIGGQFLAIFPKNLGLAGKEFIIRNFNSPISQFKASDLKF